MSEENVQKEKPTPPPLREVRDGVIPKRRGRPPKVRPLPVEDVQPLAVKLPEGVVKAEGTIPTVSLTEDRIVTIHAPAPLLTLHLRRAKNEITDATGTVHIPASGAIPDGTKIVAHFYREE